MISRYLHKWSTSYLLLNQGLNGLFHAGLALQRHLSLYFDFHLYGAATKNMQGITNHSVYTSCYRDDAKTVTSQ